jgi:hypothetical protein
LQCFADYEHFFDSFEQYDLKLPDVIEVKWRPMKSLIGQVVFEDETDEDSEFIEEVMVLMMDGQPVPPILLDRKGKIFDGRHRLVAAYNLRIKRVPVVRTNFF